jgi:hypothetical protein
LNSNFVSCHDFKLPKLLSAEKFPVTFTAQSKEFVLIISCEINSVQLEITAFNSEEVKLFNFHDAYSTFSQWKFSLRSIDLFV